MQGSGYTPDRRVTPHLVALAGCVQTKLEESGIETCYGGIIAGDGIDMSAIGESGAMWWVRLGNLTVQAPGGNDNGTIRCQPIFIANVGVGYATCYPIAEDGTAMTEGQHLMLTDLVHAAMMALHRAMSCCDWAKPAGVGIGASTVVSWTPQGPDGGVLGGEWLLQFEIIGSRPQPVED